MIKIGAYGSVCGLLAVVAALWFSLPSTPLLARVPFGGMVLDSNGGIMRIGLAADDKYRLHATLDDIAPALVDAVLNYEDKYFYSHPGINLAALLRGAASLGGRRRLGGSTITMQTARLLFNLKTSSISGKLAQIWLALAIELKHSKAEILEAYFNLAPYGANVEGIEAASRIYFHKPASMLTRQEAKALAIVPQNPVSRQPGIGAAFNRARGLLAGGNAPIKVYGLSRLPFTAPHLSLELLKKNSRKCWQTGIEPDLQRMLENSLTNFAERGCRFGLNNASAILLRHTDMLLAASVGSASYRNAAISGAIDGVRIKRSPGSTLKPFIYAMALDQGLIHPQTILADSPKSFGGYDPENFDKAFRGPVPAHEALKASRNLPAITLAEQLREPGLYGFLKAAGINLPYDSDYYGLALALGGAEISMRELASLYAMLANHGLLKEIRLAKDWPEKAPLRLLSPEAAWLTLNMLARPETDEDFDDMASCYKTGTSNGLRDAWTAGIIGDYVLIVWAGNFDNSSNPYLVGAQAALPLFQQIASSLMAMRPQMKKNWDEQPADALKLAQADFCADTGDFYKGQCRAKTRNWFIPGVSPVRDSGIWRKILVDKKTGMRACDPAGAEEFWRQFWPGNLKQIFAIAGVYKPDAPDWLPQCRESDSVGSHVSGPKIMQPKRNVTYQRRNNESAFRLPLQAAVETGSVHWYAGSQYLGTVKGGEIFLWAAAPGEWEITAVDDKGESAKQVCLVELVP